MAAVEGHLTRAIPGSVALLEVIDHRALTLLGVADRPFRREGWGWEAKFDGFRALAICEPRKVRMLTRNGNDLTRTFPEVVEALSAIRHDVTLDGELTIADSAGRPDWHAMRRRFAMRGSKAIAADAVANPATLYSFDVLSLRHRDLRPATLAARRIALIDAVPKCAHLRVPDLWDDGAALFRSVCELGLEGVVGKRLDSNYVAGRSKAWLKVRAPTARPQQRR